ncbi:MAG: hypothetical protein CM1200mP16_05750 [Nitrospina sp.]|nr:MAG: hypothetical protein CM1200mP16_05750 [Nitrospina sp.]
MDTVSQKLDELMHTLGYEKVKALLPQVDSDPLLARLKKSWK